MRVIICNLNMFSLGQAVQVYDTDENNIIYTQNIDGEDLIPAICAMAKKFNTNEVRIGGVYNYAAGLAEEVKTAYTLNYGNNNLNVEVM